MQVWTLFVDLVYNTLIGLATLFGGNMAAAIAVLSATIRLALLPLTLRMAYRSLETQRALKRLEPALAELRRKYKKDQQRLMEEMLKLHQKHGLKLVDGRTILGTLAQAPIYLGLYGAIQRGIAKASRFLWVKDLAKPDALLVALCALVGGITAAIGPHLTSQQRTTAIVVAVVLTAAILSKLAAGITIYSLTSGLVGILQAVLVRRRAARMA